MEAENANISVVSTDFSVIAVCVPQTSVNDRQ